MSGGQSEGNHIRVRRQDTMDRPAELPDALTVNDSHFKDSSPAALLDVLDQHDFHILWPESVQIQFRLDRQL